MIWSTLPWPSIAFPEGPAPSRPHRGVAQLDNARERAKRERVSQVLPSSRSDDLVRRFLFLATRPARVGDSALTRSRYACFNSNSLKALRSFIVAS